MRAVNAFLRTLRGQGHRRNRRLRLSLDLLAVCLVGSYFLADASLRRVDAVADHHRRPTDGPGQDWLLVDSARPDTGRARPAGGAAVPWITSMRLLHLPHAGGRPILISLPRDAYRWDPTDDSKMFEAAFERGGPKLLVAAVEGATGVRIDRYLEFPSTAATRGRVPFVAGITGSITVDKADRLHHLIELAFALREVDGGAAVRARLPIAGSTTIAGVGPVQLIDDAKIRVLAKAIAADRPLPASLRGD